MTAALCPKPGLALRAEGYEETARACENANPAPDLNRLKIDKALALGTAEELTPQERCLMMALLAHLDVQATAYGETSVWPGSARLCGLLGMGESTLRRLKGSLEEKGFILRKYDRMNRPLKGGALDLKPFLLRVDKLLAGIGHTENDERSRRDDLHSERYDHRSNKSTKAPTAERPIGNLPTQISERTPEPSATGKSTSPSPEEEAAERILPGITQDPLKAAASILGEKKARRLWDWAERRHGSSSLLALAIAGKSKRVRDPAAWFAWFATSAQDVDLEGLAAEIASAPVPIMQSSDPLVARLQTAFAESAGEGAALSYLSRAEIIEVDDRLEVRPTGRLAANRLQTLHHDALQRASRQLGYSAAIVRTPDNLGFPLHKGDGRPDE
ncbi:hypothetical protein HK107_00020 [Parvularcula sp. ZS-1/3]|uniref:Helix-turn-helix domain-containing protein n=1 Tax=Parvularcula mediterranea TaxID=2732508 RepID=A0A7Y3W3F7_9PROT|nr:hypothetical protein [Parvularcula mediterranea]NNU14705.1 hypothetical protein [Parvularcula mediterranea]